MDKVAAKRAEVCTALRRVRSMSPGCRWKSHSASSHAGRPRCLLGGAFEKCCDLMNSPIMSSPLCPSSTGPPSPVRAQASRDGVECHVLACTVLPPCMPFLTPALIGAHALTRHSVAALLQSHGGRAFIELSSINWPILQVTSMLPHASVVVCVPRTCRRRGR